VKLKSTASIFILAILIILAIENSREGVVYSGASPRNTGWDGTSNLVEHLENIENTEVLIVDDWAKLRDRNFDSYSCGIIFIISPEKSFTQEEVEYVANLVLEKNFNLVILDEGSYTNDILKRLGVQVEIEAYRYVEMTRSKIYIGKSSRSTSSSVITPGFIELDRDTYYLFFSYVSPVTIKNNSTCTKIAYTVEGIGVGALCTTSRGSVLVIGDGSIAVNDVIPPLPEENIYTEVLKRVINKLCVNSGKKVILIDNSKYFLKILSFGELLEEGYGFLEALAISINIFRYIYLYTQNLNLSTSLIAISIAIAILFTSIVKRFSTKKGEGYEFSRELYITIPGYGKIVVEFVEDICRSDNRCVKEIPCVAKRVLSRRCVEELSIYMSRNREFRKKVVEALLYKR